MMEKLPGRRIDDDLIWITEKKTWSALIITLRGDAFNIIQTILSDAKPNYNDLVSRLEMRYSDAHLQQVYHAQL